MKKLLMIGAGFLQTYVIKKAKDLGYCVYAVDGNPNAEGFKYADYYEAINIVDEEACLEYAKKHQIDGVLTAATDYGVLSASYIANKMNLKGLNYDSAKLIKNKYEVRKRLFEYQVDDTEQAYLVDINTDVESLANKVTYPVMVKPCDGSGSRGANRVDKASDFKEACYFAMEGSISRRAEVESFIVGEEYGVESFVENGNIHILAIIKKWMTNPPYYAELGHAIPSGLHEDLENKIKNCVKEALLALNVNHGSVNMDLLVTKDGSVHIIDVGARMGGNLIGSHIIPNGTGIDYIGNMIKAALNDEVDFVTARTKKVATRLLALTPGIVKALPDFKKIEKEYEVVIEHHLNIGDVINEYHTNLDGMGYIVAVSDNINEAISKATSVLQLIDKLIERE